MITVTWEVEDGYCGASRPQTLTIEDYEVEGMDDSEKERYIEDAVHQAFQQEITWSITDIEDDSEDDQYGKETQSAFNP